MKFPKISVIIPVYNSEKYLKRCFDSILNNNYSNIEIIVINDGSSDNSQKIIDEYVKKYPKIFISIIQKNQGIGATRNNGLKKATGKYIMFIDNDDYIDNDYFIKHINKVLKNDYDVVISGYKRTTGNKIIFKVKLNEKYPWSRHVSIAPWGKLYKKSFLEKNNIKFLITPIGEDVYFNLQVNTLTDNIKIIDYSGYNWYQNNISVTNTINQKIKNINIINLLNTHYNVLIKNKSINEKNEKIITMYFGLLIIQFLQWLSKKSKYSEISNYYDLLFNWYDEKFPKNKSINYLKLSRGDRFKNRMIIIIFMLCHKLKLGKLIVYLYGRI